MRARAAVLDSVGGRFSIEEIILDEPRDDEILVSMVATGLCHSDLAVNTGVTPYPVPAVLGHEGAGIVEHVGGAVRDIRPGDAVVMQSASCGRCLNCLQGRPLHCDAWRDSNLGSGRRSDGSSTMTRADGSPLFGCFFGQSSFATHALATERTVAKIPMRDDLWKMGPLGCGVQTGAQAVLEVLRPRPGDVLTVFGAGAVGLSAVLAAVRLTGGVVIVVDVNEERLDVATQFGATHVLDAGSCTDVPAAIRALTNGRGTDLALESSGVPKVLEDAIDALAALGTCGIVGAPAITATLTTPIVPLIAKGARLIGINQGEVVAQASIPALVDLFDAGRFPFDELLTEFAFEDINDAAEAASAGRVVKPVLRFPQP